MRGIKSVEVAAAAAKGKRAGILFGLIFGTEGLLIGACSGLLARLGLEVWISIAAAVTVGLHFIPLACLFDVRVFTGLERSPSLLWLNVF